MPKTASTRCFPLSAAYLAIALAALVPFVASAQAAMEPDLSTPAATVRTFLDAMNTQPPDMDRALACLYLDGLEDDARARAEAWALQLFTVLDECTVHLDDIETDMESGEASLSLGGGPQLWLHRYDDRLWRFSQAKTLEELDNIQAAVEAGKAEEPGNGEDTGGDERLRSPRATMRTFLEGYRTWDEEGQADLLSTLDLSEMDRSVWEDKGLELADLLKQVLDRMPRGPIVLQEIPDTTDGPPYIVYHEAKVGRIVIARNGEGDWQFTAKTLETLPALYDAVKDRRPVNGGADQPRTAALRLRNWVDAHFPSLLKRGALLENWQWIGIFLIILAGMIFSRVAAFFLRAGLRHWFQRRSMDLDARLEREFIRPIRIAIAAWVWWLGMRPLGLPETAWLFLRGAAVAVTAGAGVWAIYRLVDILGSYLWERASRTDNRYDDLLVPLITRTLKVFVVAFGLVFVADTMNWPYKSLLAGLGIGGLAFALAAKDTIENFFGSLTVLIDRPFQIGDWVLIDDIEGSVETVGMRSTRVRTFYNSLITVPNAKLISATVDNMGARRYRRIKTTLSVTYDTPPEKLEAFCEGIRELIRQYPYTRKDYYHVYFNEFGPSSLQVLLYCFVETPDWATELRERHRLLLDIVRLAKRLGVEFAFPTQTLYMRPDETPEISDSDNPKAAASKGRQEARGIISEFLGKGVTPPPVVIKAGEDTDGED